MWRERELIKVNANLTDGKLDDNWVSLQCKNAHWWVDATCQQTWVAGRDKVRFIAGHYGTTAALVFGVKWLVS